MLRPAVTSPAALAARTVYVTGGMLDALESAGRKSANEALLAVPLIRPVCGCITRAAGSGGSVVNVVCGEAAKQSRSAASPIVTFSGSAQLLLSTGSGGTIVMAIAADELPPSLVAVTVYVVVGEAERSVTLHE